MLGFSLFRRDIFQGIYQNNINEQLEFNNYICISQNGDVTIVSPNPELGQNIMTSFAMIIAEELDADWSKVKVVQGNLEPAKYTRQITGGSGAIQHSWDILRKAGATAKMMLVEVAAARWNVPISECNTSEGVVTNRLGEKLRYEELAEEASQLNIPDNVTLKNPKKFKLVGTSIVNVANHDIISGKPIFGIDYYREGMLTAVIQRPKVFGSQIGKVDSVEAENMPGITNVIIFNNNVAVVGKSTWEVLKARSTLKVEYNEENEFDPTELLSITAKPDAALVVRKDGDYDSAEKEADEIVSREYECPFLPHNTMEPMNFFADVKPGSVELIGPTQVPAMAVLAVAELLHVSPNDITLKLTRLGGGFGRRLQVDYVLEAAQLSSIIKKPVKVIWTREDDMTGGYYRPAVRYKLSSTLQGNEMTGYKLEGVGFYSEKLTREENFPCGSVENVLISSRGINSPITTGAWRSPVANFLAFAEQCFLDEVACKLNRDPINFQLSLLQKAKTSVVGSISYSPDRMEAVINLVAKKSKWKSNSNIFQGFSAYFSSGSYVAQVCDVSIIKGIPKVKKIHIAIDCGTIINLSGAHQQVVGSIVDGYGHAMYGKLSFIKGATQQSNFDNYRLIRMKEVPMIDVHFIANNLHPSGLGEPALPPTASAVANAIFQATGYRIRRQPFIDHEIFQAVDI